MAKRTKRIEKGVESIKKEIEEHFKKIEQDIKEKNVEKGLYHAKEIDKSLIKALEIKLNILNKTDNSVQTYKEKLNKLKKQLQGN
jgi:hypothetical protein